MWRKERGKNSTQHARLKGVLKTSYLRRLYDITERRLKDVLF